MPSRKGAPTIAPIATSSEPASELTIAMIAISVSGAAVPAAARTLPNRPLPQPEAVAQPLDRVGEEQGPGEHDREGDDEEQLVHRARLSAVSERPGGRRQAK